MTLHSFIDIAHRHMATAARAVQTTAIHVVAKLRPHAVRAAELGAQSC